MNTHPLDIFETHEDHVSWDKYLEQVDLFEQLSAIHKQRAKEAIRYLRVLLGENFLRLASEKGNPIFHWFFLNATPHARLSLIRFVEELKTFENASKFNGLVARLKSSEKAAEALTVLDAAYKFSHAGFAVSFDPEVKSIGKVPDLRLVDPENGEDIYVEVSRLRKGGHQELGSRTYHVIFDEVLNAIWSCSDASDVTKPHVLPYVRILKSLGENNLREVVAKIRELIFEAATSRGYFEYKFKDAIEMAVSPAHDHSKAKAWASVRGMRDMVEAPPIPLDGEIRKARDKIAKELEQLPEDRPGIIVIPASESLLPFVFDPKQIIVELAEELRHHPSLLSAVISHTFSAGKQDSYVAAVGQHAVVGTQISDIATERSVLAMNDAFGLAISTATVEKIRKAFILHN